MSDEILRADLALRRKTLLILGIAIVLAIGCLFAFHRWLIETVVGIDVHAAITRVRGMIGLALTASAVCLAVLAAYSARKGARARDIEQWPLPGARVLRDTPIRRGAAARRIGRWLQATAILLTVLAIGVGLVSWRLFNAGA